MLCSQWLLVSLLCRLKFNLIAVCHQSTLRDEPVRFSGSGADRESYETFRQDPPPPSYQKNIVRLSLAAFLLYFLFLREENDIDDYLSAHVFNIIDPYAELQRLEARLVDEEAKGMNTSRTKAQILEMSALIQERNEYGILQASLNRAKAEKMAKEARAK